MKKLIVLLIAVSLSMSAAFPQERLAGDDADVAEFVSCDHTIMYRVRVLYRMPQWPDPANPFSQTWYWVSEETAPYYDWADADARRWEIIQYGYTWHMPPDPYCWTPGNCSDVHVAPGNIAFVSVKLACCQLPPPGPSAQACEDMDSQPPPFP